VEWLTHFVWSEIRKIIRNPESLREMIAELSDSESRKGSLIKDREAYEQTIQRIERKKEQLVKSLIRIEPDDADTVALFETEIKSLNQQKRDVEDSLAHVKSCLKDVEENSLDVEGLVELHHKLSFGDEDWDDHKKRDYIEKLDYQIYFDGRSCEIRMRTGKVVSSFTEETALLARDNGSDPQDSDSEGFVSTEFVCKHSSRSPTTSGRRAMCR
jgi:hypothetical protein